MGSLNCTSPAGSLIPAYSNNLKPSIFSSMCHWSSVPLAFLIRRYISTRNRIYQVKIHTYIHIYIHRYILKYVCIKMYIDIDLYVYITICIYTYIYKCIYRYTYRCRHSIVYTNICAYVLIDICSDFGICTYSPYVRIWMLNFIAAVVYSDWYITNSNFKQ